MTIKFWKKALRARVIFIICVAFATSTAAQTQQTVERTVERGETLYKIAREYGVSIDDIISQNPVLKTEPLKAGQTLRIALPSAVSRTAVGDTQQCAPPDAPQPAQNVRTVPAEHKVKKGETLWSISRAYGITVDALIAANPEMQEAGYKLKKGRSIVVPASLPVSPAPAPKGLAAVNISVVLPLQEGGVAAARSAEYVRGMLLAVQQMKRQGRSVTVHVYEEPPSATSLRSVMQRIGAHGADLIVGPAYPSHWGEVIGLSPSYAKIVIPFSSKVQQVATCPRLFMLNAPAQSEEGMLAELVAASFHKDATHVIFLTHRPGDARADKSGAAAALKNRLALDGYKTTALPADADLTAVKGALRKGTFNLLATDASDADTQQRLQSIATALRQTLPAGTQLALLGYDAWPDRAAAGSALREGLYAADTYVAATAFYYPYTRAAMAFEADYKKWFGADLLAVSPRVAPLGYDTAMAFVNGLSVYGKAFGTQRQALPLLQSDLRFAKVSEQGGYVNQSAWLIHYKPDKTIDKIAKTR